MPHQTRRWFAASAIALAGTGAMRSSAQDATPEAAVLQPADVLAHYIDAIWNGRDIGSLGELFDEGRLEIEGVMLEHLELRQKLRVTTPSVKLTTILEDQNTAIGYGEMTGGDDIRYLFILIQISYKGRISRYRWMMDPPL